MNTLFDPKTPMFLKPVPSDQTPAPEKLVKSPGIMYETGEDPSKQEEPVHNLKKKESVKPKPLYIRIKESNYPQFLELAKSARRSKANLINLLIENEIRRTRGLPLIQPGYTTPPMPISLHKVIKALPDNSGLYVDIYSSPDQIPEYAREYRQMDHVPGEIRYCAPSAFDFWVTTQELQHTKPNYLKHKY